MNTETYPDLIETLSFLKFPDEKHLLYFSDSDNDNDNDNDLSSNLSSNLSSVPVHLTKTSTQKSLDLLLSSTLPIKNDIFTESLSSKRNSVKSKKNSVKSKKNSVKSKK